MFILFSVTQFLVVLVLVMIKTWWEVSMSSIVTCKWLFNVILILNTHTGSPEPLRPHRNHLPDRYRSISPASVRERVTEPPAECPSFEAFYTRCEDAGLPRDVWWLYADELYLQNEIKSVIFTCTETVHHWKASHDKPSLRLSSGSWRLSFPAVWCEPVREL